MKAILWCFLFVLGVTGNQVFAQAKPSNSSKGYDLINHVYFDKQDADPVPLEKAISSSRTKMKAMGYGGSSTQQVIQGEKSNVRIGQNASLSFVINTGGTAPELTLNKLESGKQERYAVTMQVKGAFKRGPVMSGGGNSLAFSIRELRAGLYQISLTQTLDKGEYFFAAKPSVNGFSNEVFAFGID